MPDIVDITIFEDDDGRLYATRRLESWGRRAKVFDTWMHEYETLRAQEEDVLKLLEPYEATMEGLYFVGR